MTIPQPLLTTSKPLDITSSGITLIFWWRAKQTTIVKSKRPYLFKNLSHNHTVITVISRWPTHTGPFPIQCWKTQFVRSPLARVSDSNKGSCPNNTDNDCSFQYQLRKWKADALFIYSSFSTDPVPNPSNLPSNLPATFHSFLSLTYPLRKKYLSPKAPQ